MSQKTFRLYPWVYCNRGVNGITLYNWLNKKILSLNKKQSEILEKLLNKTFINPVDNYKKILDKLEDFGFVSSEDIYIDTNITAGSKLQNAMDIINTFNVYRLDLVLSTFCSKYNSCPIRNSKVISHACESCLGCTKEKLDKTFDYDRIIRLLEEFRPFIVTLSGGELFSNISVIDSILSLLLINKYTKIVILIMPIHAILKFKSKIKKYANLFMQTGKRLMLTAVLTDQDLESVPRILEIETKFNIPLAFTLYVKLDHFYEVISSLDNSIWNELTVVPAFYSSNDLNIHEELDKNFLSWQLSTSYIIRPPSIESLTNSIEHNYANCLYGNIMLKFPEEVISPCKGYYLLNYKLNKVTRKTLQEVMSLWEDPCKDCSLKAACTMCRSIVKIIHPDPNSCPVWKKVQEVEK